MTERIDDGWPEQYRDPLDRPHPSMLCITVESGEEVREDTRAPLGAVEEGENTPAVVSFRSVGDRRKILGESIAALAANLDRDDTAVHDDVSLADYGLLFVIEDGHSRRPYLPDERIHLEVELVGRHPGERAGAA
jgi:predicted transcriptional regulator